MNIKALIIDDSMTDLQEIDTEMKKICSHTQISMWNLLRKLYRMMKY